MHALDAFRRGDEAQGRDRAGVAGLEHVAHGGERAAGGEHRIDDVRRSARELGREPLQVGEGSVGRLVALQADHADLGVGERGQHTVEEAEPGSEDRHDERAGGRRPCARRDETERRGDLVLLGGQVTSGLVGEEARELTRDAAEVDRLRPFVAQRQHSVGDEWMIDDDERHTGK